MSSGEMLKKVETASQSSLQTSRYKALRTMEDVGYNPVKELIMIAQELRSEEARDFNLEVKIHIKLLEYFSATPNKQLDLNVQQQTQIAVLPVSYSHLYEGKSLEACRPKLLDVHPINAIMDEIIDVDSTSDSDSEP